MFTRTRPKEPLPVESGKRGFAEIWRSLGVKALPLGVLMSFAMESPVAAEDFILVGDLPYTESQAITFRDRIAPAIAASGASAVVHVGDIKGSKEVCSDGLLTARRDAIHALMPGRVFYTPGDNDWTDCDRDSTGLAMREYDRLTRLRQLFFEPPPPDAFTVARQEGYPENALWRVGDTIFVTLHVVGTNNGRQQIYLDETAFALEQVESRDRANSAWLDRAVEEAISGAAAAMVIAAQADLTKPWGKGACTAGNRTHCDAFAALRNQLRLAAGRFSRPMLYVHGDTDPYCLDRDFGGPQAPNLWRLNGAGDYAVIDAVRVSVDPHAAVPFESRTLLSGASPREGC